MAVELIGDSGGGFPCFKLVKESLPYTLYGPVGPVSARYYAPKGYGADESKGTPARVYARLLASVLC